MVSTAAFSALFAETSLPDQKLLVTSDRQPAVLFPTVLVPSPSWSESDLDVARLKEAVREHKPKIEELLRSSGAVLFRGFPVVDASDFDEVVGAFGYENYPYVGGVATRTKVVGGVYTANDAPPELEIPFHHELSHVPQHPSKLFFFCEQEPQTGGETPIIFSNHVYQMVLKKHPDFIEKLAEHGLIYKWFLHNEDDNSVVIGRGWQSTFSTDDKSLAQQRACEKGIKLDWMDNGVQTTIGPSPAFKLDESRGNMTWFNGVFSTYAWRNITTDDGTNAATFGDGTKLPEDVIVDCIRMVEEECIVIPWKKGDFLLLDNKAVLHARRSFVPPRRILASFVF